MGVVQREAMKAAIERAAVHGRAGWADDVHGIVQHEGIDAFLDLLLAAIGCAETGGDCDCPSRADCWGGVTEGHWVPAVRCRQFADGHQID